MLECAGVCCKFVLCNVKWEKSRGTLVWLSQSKGFVVLLLGVKAAWVQVMMRVHFCLWKVQYVQALGC